MNKKNQYAYATDQTFPEELANSLTHGLGLILSIVGTITLAVLLVQIRAHASQFVIFSIYSFSLITLYMVSTLYHSLPNSIAKRIFVTLDHCSIYLMIAGCYVPFTLVTLKSRLGLILLITVTGLALLGIFLKILCFKRSEKFCLALYIVMGWMIAIAIEPLFRALPFGGMALLVSGGISYSLGVPFFKADHIPFNHAIWHGFVLTGSICHYLCVLYYVLPL